MFKSQTNLFSKIICPSIELKEHCETLNCIFRHPEDEEKRKLIRSSFNKAEYTDRYQAFINPNFLDKRHRSLDKTRRTSSKASSFSEYEVRETHRPPSAAAHPATNVAVSLPKREANWSPDELNDADESPYLKRLRLSGLPMGGEGVEPPEWSDGEMDFQPPPPPKMKVTSTNLTPLKARRRFGSSSSGDDASAKVEKDGQKHTEIQRRTVPERFANESRPQPQQQQQPHQPFKARSISPQSIERDETRVSSPEPVAPSSMRPPPASSNRVIGAQGGAKPTATSGLKRLIGGKNLISLDKTGAADTNTNGSSTINLQNITKDIDLIPQPIVPFPPAQTSVRLRYLTLLQHLYQTLDLKFPNRDAVVKEYEIAASTTNRTYENVIKREIYQMANPDITDKSSKDSDNAETEKNKRNEILNSLVADKKKLSQNGYITEIPQVPEDFQSATATKCDRCGLDFDITKIFKRTKCLYHPDRFSLSRQTTGSHASNDINSKYYPCCSQPVGESEGCKRSRYHVFKRDSPEELHHAIPFISTTEFTKTPETLEAIALDCEMGYTTLGFELIRVTMVDFISEKVVYDKTIKPEGRIVDLNTYWSGVQSIDEENSPDFSTFLQEISHLIDKDTILIGHSLENDLNVMRLVHHRVVDTSLMFANGLRKRSLKDITFEYLSKKIQGGEHDSEEDAKSCIGLVKWQISQLMK